MRTHGTTSCYRNGCRCDDCRWAVSRQRDHDTTRRPTFMCPWCGRSSVSESSCKECQRLTIPTWGQPDDSDALTGGYWSNDRGISRWIPADATHPRANTTAATMDYTGSTTKAAPEHRANGVLPGTSPIAEGARSTNA